MKDRIIQLLNIEGLSASKFADIIGVQRSSMSHILSGRNNPSLDFIQKIMHAFPRINGDWLLSGDGEMIKGQTSGSLFQETIKEEEPLSYQANQPLKQIKKETNEKIEQKNDHISEIESTALSSEKTIEKIVVFYTDKTFKEYNPT